MLVARRRILTVAELTSKAGKIGGKARMALLTPEERTELAHKAGQVGGKARAAKLSRKRRSDIARKAAAARWAKAKGETRAE